MSDYVVTMENITKNFGSVPAVVNGQFNLKKGEIHSLIGENGAGKSTMMKLLFGMYPFDSGKITVNGAAMKNITPGKAISNGIGMVHQEFMLVNNLTVIENIILGFEPKKCLTIDYDKAKIEVEKYIEQYHLDVPMNRKVRQISVGEAQRVEIIKTLIHGAEIIIFDEPTAVLTPQETKKLFEILKKLKEDGKSIVFISHKLNEVMEVSDRITVMRHGKYMGTVQSEETSPVDLTQRMIGREVFLNIDKSYEKAGDVILKIEDVWIPSQKETSKIRGLSLDVKEGEIVGIAGIDGNGQSEFVEAITGLRKIEKGKVYLNDKDITNKLPAQIRKMGLAHIPEDRNKRGLNREMSIVDNAVSVIIDSKPYVNGVILNKKSQNDYAEKIIKEFDIRPSNYNIKASSMSGGNAQKLVVAREVSLKKKVLIASQPTRGVDVGAIEIIRNTLEKVKKQGAAILLISAELEEIISLSDRIAIIHEGRIVGEMPAKDANENNLGIMMMGGTDITRETGDE